MPEEKDPKEQEEQQRQIMQSGSVTTETHGKHVIHCLTIIGQIEGHYILPAQNKTTKYEPVIPLLVAIEQDPEIEGLIVILNTVGGDVDGLHGADFHHGNAGGIAGFGGGYSIGGPPACSAKYSLSPRQPP
ncbi:MAG: hypothetical protein ACLRXC_06630 [[Clostridium] leptum]